MATKTGPKRAPKGTSPKALSQFKDWGDQVTRDMPDLQAFLNRRVDTTPKAPADYGTVPFGRTSPDDLETSVAQQGGTRGSGYGLSFPTSGASTTFAGGADRKSSSRIIILAMGVAGAATILGGSKTSYTVGSTKIPGNMRAFAGVIVAGTVALVINEVSPSLGMLFGVSLIFVAVADAKVFESFGNAIFGKSVSFGSSSKIGEGPSRAPGPPVYSQPGVTPGGLGGTPPGPTGGLGGLYNP